MKRLSLLLACILVSLLTFAQDIIITRDAQRIEGKVKEVSPTEIRYLYWDNLDGPVFVLPTTEIATITFQNGKVQVFNNERLETTPSETAHLADTTNLVDTTKLSDDGMIRMSGSHWAPFYILKRDGKETTMDGSELVKFFNTACPEAYNEYVKGVRLYWGGYFLMCGSLGLLVTSLLYINDSIALWGSLLAASCILDIASITLAYTGKQKARDSYKIYNAQCSKRATTLSLSTQVSQNGIGLALRF